MTVRWLLWVLAGALCCLTLLAMLSIGFLIAPFAALAILAATRWAGNEPILPGLLAGAGLIVIAIGVINLGNTPCPSSGGGYSAAGDTSEFSCGGMSPTPWLVIGASLIVAGLATALRARREPPPQAGATS